MENPLMPITQAMINSRRRLIHIVDTAPQGSDPFIKWSRVNTTRHTVEEYKWLATAAMRDRSTLWFGYAEQYGMFLYMPVSRARELGITEIFGGGPRHERTRSC